MLHQANELLWAKFDDRSWHPLFLHLLDVAAVAKEIICREPEKIKDRMADIVGLPWEEASPWLLILIACHDLGKACPGFQAKWPEQLARLERLGLQTSPKVKTSINHAYVSQVVLAKELCKRDWPVGLAEDSAAAIGCHHGSRATATELSRHRPNSRDPGAKEWKQSRSGVLDELIRVLSPGTAPTKNGLNGPDFMLLAGLTSFADWIASDSSFFPYGRVEDCRCAVKWYETRRVLAEKALDSIGWFKRSPLSSHCKSFEEVFALSPRPLQQAVADVLPSFERPGILLVEAPMGEGKTKAAFFAHLELQRRLGHRGLYIALPTRATGNAMFETALEFLSETGKNRYLDFQLVQGGATLNQTYRQLRLTDIHGDSTEASVRAGEWFTPKKRALLSEYGVGTVDQALLPILPVKHQFVRLWGLANRVVVFDEVHAYDTYTGTLLLELLHWLVALDSSVVLLSATLPTSFRKKLGEVFQIDMPQKEKNYPRLSLFHKRKLEQFSFQPDTERRLSISLSGIVSDVQAMRSEMEDRMQKGGLGLVLCNTVKRAQDIFCHFSEGESIYPPTSEARGDVFHGQSIPIGKRLPDGTEVYLFHARFPAGERSIREECALRTFGEKAERSGRKILIATQVVEQSLNLDFDVMMTDLAPIDLILQRAGRLWRYRRSFRPQDKPRLIIAGLAGESPGDFGKPMYWDAIYREDILLRTWIALHKRQSLTLPDEIDFLVQEVYDKNLAPPPNLEERLKSATETAERQLKDYEFQAIRATIGSPDNAEWKTPPDEKYDEDAPEVHRSLRAQTRLGDESVLTIPISLKNISDLDGRPNAEAAMRMFGRTLALSRKSVVYRLKKIGIPDGWRKSPLLRNCYPMILDDDGCWEEDIFVRLDSRLGLVFEAKEEE